MYPPSSTRTPPSPKGGDRDVVNRGHGWVDGWMDVFEKRTDDQARKDGWTFSGIDISGIWEGGSLVERM